MSWVYNRVLERDAVDGATLRSDLLELICRRDPWSSYGRDEEPTFVDGLIGIVVV